MIYTRYNGTFLLKSQANKADGEVMECWDRVTCLFTDLDSTILNVRANFASENGLQLSQSVCWKYTINETIKQEL